MEDMIVTASWKPTALTSLTVGLLLHKPHRCHHFWMLLLEREGRATEAQSIARVFIEKTSQTVVAAHSHSIGTEDAAHSKMMSFHKPDLPCVDIFVRGA
jgi:hypothetical protein